MIRLGEFVKRRHVLNLNVNELPHCVSSDSTLRPPSSGIQIRQRRARNPTPEQSVALRDPRTVQILDSNWLGVSHMQRLRRWLLFVISKLCRQGYKVCNGSALYGKDQRD
jgi:hypothetical protein